MNLLTSQEKQDVIKDIKKYEKIFDQEDKERKNELLSAVIEERKVQAAAFFERLYELRSLYQSYRSEKIELRGGYDSNDDSNYI